MTEIVNAAIVTTDADSLKNEPEYRLYKRRWVILGIFSVFSFFNSVQGVQYIIINNLIMKYYRVPSYAVDWTSTIYMVAYLPLLFPALWLLDAIGIRYCMLLSSAGLSIGAWIKVFASVKADWYVVVLLGQMCEAVFAVLVFGLAARIPAVWFGSNEVSLAFALATFGDEFGCAIGMYLPTRIVKNTNHTEEIGSELLRLNLIISIGTTFILIAVLFFFADKPKKPPSSAQIVQRLTKETSFIGEVKSLTKSKSFFLMTIAYGINVAALNAFLALFNTGFLKYFPKYEEHVGNVGFLMLCSGIFGSIVIGYILDKTHLFKEIVVFLYGGSFLTMVMYTYALRSDSLMLVYISATLLGLSQMAYYSVAVQLGIELSYPVSECISSSYLLLASNVFGIILINVYRYIYDTSGDLWANSGLSFVLLIGTVITITIPSKLRRQNAEMKEKCET